MTEEQSALAKRVVAYPRWKWLPGMQTHDRLRVEFVSEDGDLGHACGLSAEGALPDLSDAATIGCLVALVRAAYNDPTAQVTYDEDDDEWAVRITRTSGANLVGYGLSEAEALVAALGNAP